VAAIVLAACANGDAFANGAGLFGRSGRTVGFTCAAAACHFPVTGASGVSFVMTPTNPDAPPIAQGFVPGAAYTVTVSITGGPRVRNGFCWDSNGGTSRATDANVQVNTNPFRPAEAAHTLAGAGLAAWSFEWTAPAERNAIGFWLAGDSGDGDGTRTGDDPTAPFSTQAPPLPVEILARIGNVNDTLGDPVPVLFVNGSRGDDARLLAVPTGGTPMTVSLGTYPGAPPAIPYVLYAIRRENRPGDEATIPGVGLSSFPFPPSGGTPIVVANTLGHEPRLGAPRLPATPLGPGPILTFLFIPARLAGASLTLQGLVPDATAPTGGAVSNAIVMTFR
jgi:hypothetical protein